jgi:uncharacterized protein (TIGR00255 family)
MVRSMTGFGEAQRETAVGIIDIQIRTVNHRHFHTHFRLPLGAERWEAELTQILRGSLTRGHVHYRLGHTAGVDRPRPVGIDHARVAGYLEALCEIKRRHGVEGEPDLALVTRFNDVFQSSGEEVEDLSFDEVAAATREALERVVESREREGEVLAADMTASIIEIESALTGIEERAPQRLLAERDRLRSAVAELAGEAAVDVDRLAREIAYLAERWDINEEIVRLRSHTLEFRSLVDGGAEEPVGKRLGFWVQEMHREANTIGSKANDADIARLSVQIKTAIEKLREQVENVE